MVNYQKTEGRCPFDLVPPSVADGFYLAFYPLAYVAVMLAIRTEVRSFRSNVWLDGAVADVGASTLSGMHYHDAPVSGTPIPDAAVAWLDCSLERSVELGSHTLFIGQVVDAAFRDEPAGELELLRVEDTKMNYGAHPSSFWAARRRDCSGMQFRWHSRPRLSLAY